MDKRPNLGKILQTSNKSRPLVDRPPKVGQVIELNTEPYIV